MQKTLPKCDEDEPPIDQRFLNWSMAYRATSEIALTLAAQSNFDFKDNENKGLLRTALYLMTVGHHIPNGQWRILGALEGFHDAMIAPEFYMGTPHALIAEWRDREGHWMTRERIQLLASVIGNRLQVSVEAFDEEQSELVANLSLGVDLTYPVAFFLEDI